ncbi:hypothetical protein HYPSUDRAFT_585582 [Hypholoma sublateritium FD-334 SS-4]|uniref:Uncharacterized protein n=1 Tax=Hypholoma sublateritium (strain FD-334 SS-4) TaxID=945553 RepID=A0A0D2P3V2_HYPSF|nr:hypothetical protein HYPSUDRAFT_585582 [Hypholoma sublateritium FD-334 SS-4]
MYRLMEPESPGRGPCGERTPPPYGRMLLRACLGFSEIGPSTRTLRIRSGGSRAWCPYASSSPLSPCPSQGSRRYILEYTPPPVFPA